MDIKSMKEAVQVEDDQIILGEPLILNKYGKQFKLEQIKYLEWDKFTINLVIFLNHYYIICGFSKLPDSLNELNEFRDNIRSAIGDKKALKALFKMMKLSRLNVRFIRKKFTPDDLAEMFLYMYLFNVMGVKKNFKDALKQIKMVA